MSVVQFLNGCLRILNVLKVNEGVFALHDDFTHIAKLLEGHTEVVGRDVARDASDVDLCLEVGGLLVASLWSR